MRNKEITKKIFYLTLFLLIINFLIFLSDRILGFVILGYGVTYYFPVAILIVLLDRFYFKNKSRYFYGVFIFFIISLPLAYWLSQLYFNSVFSIM
jgi:hypothetical protein